jgi:hypothetical protein
VQYIVSCEASAPSMSVSCMALDPSSSALFIWSSFASLAGAACALSPAFFNIAICSNSHCENCCVSVLSGPRSRRSDDSSCATCVSSLPLASMSKTYSNNVVSSLPVVHPNSASLACTSCCS